MKINSFEDIKAWKKARELNKKIFDICTKIKKNEYFFSEHLKKTSISIMANIAEGFARDSKKEFIRFLFYSKGSAAELKSHLYITLDCGFLSEEDFNKIYDDIDHIEKMISNFIKYLKKAE